MILPHSRESIIDLGYRPRPWQESFHRKRKRFSVMVCHRRAGKTVVSVRQLIDSALRCTLPNPRFAYIAPLFVQAKAVAWQYLKDFTAPIPGVRVNESECWVELPNKARIRIYGGDNPDALRGLYLDGVVLDEVAQMVPTIWGEVLRPALADRKGWALFIGTPAGLNLLSELYFSALKDPSWYAAAFTVDDTHAIPAEELADARKTMSDEQYAREFMCDFSAGGEATLLSLNDVMEACQRNPKPDQYQFAPKILGIDVARMGGDRTVLIKRQGIACWDPLILTGKDSTQVGGSAIKIIDDWKPDAVMIDGTGGYGAGVIDFVRRLGHKALDVQFGGKPGDLKFLNKRAEIWWKMAEWVKTEGALPDMASLRADLCSPTYKHNNTGKLQIESKEDMKARGMPSPDIADALACTFAYSVAAPGTNSKSHAITAATSSYRPFANKR